MTSTAEQAIDRGAKAPTDRLGKLPRRVTVGVYLDEQLAEEWERAVAELDAFGKKQAAEHQRQAGLVCAAARDAGTSEAEALAELDTEDRAARVPYEQRVDQTLAALDEGTLWLTFRSLGRRRFRDIVEEHPASEQDQQDWADAGQHNKAPYAVGSFAPALVREASHQPQLSKADVDAIFEGEAWNEQEVTGVYQAALAAQTAARSVTHRTAPRR